MIKKLLVVSFFVFTTISFATNTVDGDAFLENQTDHSGIQVVFEQTAPSTSTDTSTTDASGYYTAQLENGIYDITYSKDGFVTQSLTDQTLFANTTLSDITLLEHNTLLNVPAVYSTIQTAIDAAVDGDTVLVQSGTYVENINYNGKNIVVGSLFLTTQDTSYISSTIIDGNEAGSVVTFESGENTMAVLSGFTIQNGLDNSSNRFGGGIYCENTQPTITNCTISDNTANRGGGIYCSYSDATLTNVTISGNIASTDGGGSASASGGGIELADSDAILTNVTISGNTAFNNGGGIHCYISNPTLTNVTISGNTGYSGGGMDLFMANPTLTNVTISSNTSNASGGGISCNQSNPTLTNVTISDNTASGYGGGMSLTDSSPSLVNTIVSDNTGNYGIYVSSGTPSITYLDLYNNENGNCYGCGDWVGVNVMTNANGDSCDLYYNIQEDPLFVDPDNGDYNLQQGSPCIDGGDPTSPFDPDGSIVDMGAFPSSYGTPPIYSVIHVSTTGSDSNDGSEASPYATIQKGIDVSSSNDTVLVQSGTYVENINYNGKNIVVGSLYLTTSDTSYISSTIIDGNESGSVVTFGNNEDSTAILIGFTIQNGSSPGGGGIDGTGSNPTLKNLTIINNTSTANGGGIKFSASNSSPSLENVTISGNTADFGGGIYCASSDPTLTNVTISGNTADDGGTGGYGGGIYCENSQPTLTNVTISSNTSNASGGGMILWGGSNATLTNVTISGNVASGYGGGINSENSQPTLTNVTISGNAAQNGGGIYFNDSNPTLTNVTISSNTASGNGGGLYLWESIPTIINSIIWNNIPGSVTAEVYEPIITYSDIEDGYTGTGNIDADPLFCNSSSGDYYLADTSPCVGTGENGANMGAFGVGCEAENTITDIDGNVYQTVQIGDQLWMKENLKVTHYKNGDEIPNIQSSSEWENLSTGAYANYGSNADIAETYGKLYNWYAVDDERCICPEGWHVPTDNEWKELEIYLGMSQEEADETGWERGTDEGGKLKEEGTEHWDSPNTGATNETNFTALPGGVFRDDGLSLFLGEAGNYWTSSENIDLDPLHRRMAYNTSTIYRHNDLAKNSGGSVRCLFGLPSEPTWYVSTTGSDSNDGSESSPYATIQKGIDVSSSNDTVLVQSGTYVENINYNGKNIVVGSLFLTTQDTSYISSTIIDGNESGSVVTFGNNEDLTALLIGFTIQNGAGGSGGGISCNSSSPSLENIIITGNTASVGGGMYINNSNPTLTNVTISGNTASVGGGGIYCSSSSLTLTNVTISSNTSNGIDQGGGIYLENNTNLNLVNCILWNDSPQEIYAFGALLENTITISYSDINGGQTGIVTNDNAMINWGTGNIDSDPLFCNADNNDFTLYDNSPCVGTGENGANMGALGVGCSSGPYSGPTWYVSTTGSDSNEGSESSPFVTIQTGIDSASSGHTVLVAAGTYVENINYNGKNISVIGEDSSNTIIDGNESGSVVHFVNNEDSTALLENFTIQNGSGWYGPWDQYRGGGIVIRFASPQVKSCIIENNNINNTAEHGGGIYIDGESSPLLENLIIRNNISSNAGGISINSSSVVTLKNSIVESNEGLWGGGITINGDHILDNVIISSNEGNLGGGIYSDNSSFTFDGGTISNNTASGSGGGIYANNSSFTIDSSIIDNNVSNQIGGDWLDGGGGIFSTESFFIIENTTISNNSAAHNGGGVYFKDNTDQSIFDNCNIFNNSAVNHGGAVFGGNSQIKFLSMVMDNNSAAQKGGAVFLNYCTSEFIRVRVYENEATSYGGGISLDHGSAVITNVTLVNNSAVDGGGIHVDYSGSGNYTLVFNNSILWGNTTNDITIDSEGNPNIIETYNYSMAINGLPGTGNLFSNPLFADINNGDLTLQWGSPAIDAGDPDLDGDGSDYTTDTDDQDPDGTRMDMGAYYFNQNDTIPPDLHISSLSSTNVGTEDSITVFWEVGLDVGLDTALIELLYTDTTILVDIMDPASGQATIDVPDSSIESFQIVVTVWDFAHNVSSDTTETISVFDNTSPVVTVLNPQSGYSIPENTELTVTWNATDNISLDSIVIYYSNDGGNVFTQVGEFSAGQGEGSFVIPPGFTTNAQLKLVVEDIYDNTGEGFSDNFTVTDNTPPTVELLSPVMDTELGTGTVTQITWLADDNDTVDHINLEYMTDALSWTVIAENEVDDGEFDWLVPNTPSTSVSLRVLAFDPGGRSDTSRVENLSIIINYPVVTQIFPSTNQLTWRDDQIMVTFSQAMDSTTISMDNITIQANHSGDLNPAIRTINSAQSFILDFPQSFASLDTVTLTLSSEMTNVFGFELDGDGDEVPGGDYSFTYNVGMLADYDTTGTIDALDLATIVQALDEDDYYNELGPVTGTAPHFTSILDSVMDIEDVMAFVMMWNWYVTNNGGLLRQLADFGEPIDIEATHDSLYFDLPRGVLAYEVQVQHNPDIISFGTVESNSTVKLQSTDKEVGLFNFINAPNEQTHVSIPINMSGKEVDITFVIRAIGYDNRIISQQTSKMTVHNIPEQFALHHNYPNPFNPVTTIQFDIPVDAEVILVVYDILGRHVKTLIHANQTAGYKSIRWNGTNDQGRLVSAGMYFYHLQTVGYSKIRKMVLLK